MNCEKTITRFLEQEDYTRLSTMVRLHSLFCPACRGEIKKIQRSFLLISEVAIDEMPVNLTSPIMRAIEEFEKPYEHEISGLKWLAAGSVMFASILATPFNKHLNWLNEYFGGNLEIPMALVLGSAITVYAIIFAGSHLGYVNKDRIVKFINRFIDVQ